MLINLVDLETMMLLVTPTPVELSVWIDDLGCGQPISMRDWWSETMFFAVTKSATSLDSATDDMIHLFI